jgi:hypothetical protein
MGLSWFIMVYHGLSWFITHMSCRSTGEPRNFAARGEALGSRAGEQAREESRRCVFFVDVDE